MFIFYCIYIEGEIAAEQNSTARQGQICFGVHKDNNLWQ